MTSAASSPLDEVRNVLFGAERTEIDEMRLEVQALKTQVAELQDMLIVAEGRTDAVGEVLVGAVAIPERPTGQLGSALRPDIEFAVNESARLDSKVLAEALYPVMGPAIRKMIAELFTFDSASRRNQPFVVDQVLLIERSTGLLLAASIKDEERADEADIVSGMLDAIRLFVQEAFDAEEHDGLRDLRVGDTSVLVEWGPKAVLASVIRGVPADEYRHRAAETLELLHARFAHELTSFDGDIEPFTAAEAGLQGLRVGKFRKARTATSDSPFGAIAAALVLVVVIILVLVWLL